MGTVPSLIAKVAGNRVRATDFNAVKDYLDFLNDTPHCSVYNGGTISMVAATARLILFDTETDDTDGMHSTSTNSGRIVFQTPGRFSLGIYVDMPGVTYTTFLVDLRLNSGGSGSGGTRIRGWQLDGGTADVALNITRVFGSGDYVEVFVTLNSAQTTGTGGQFSNGFQARYIGQS